MNCVERRRELYRDVQARNKIIYQKRSEESVYNR